MDWNSNTPKKPSKNLKSSRIIAFVIFVLVLLFGSRDQEGKEYRVYKKRLLDKYDVDYKTFSKWVQHFASNLWELDDYKVRRKLTFFEELQLTMILGYPSEQTPVMTKADIAAYCDSDKRTLRDCIMLCPEKYGLTKEAYQSLNKFPPEVAQSIIRAYQ